MKKYILLGMSFVVFSIFGIMNTEVKAEQMTLTSSGETVIYNKFGQEVKPETLFVQPRGTTSPTTLKWLSFGSNYHSNPFSGAGTRYSGYIFGLNSTNRARLTFSLGGFACFVTDRPDPASVVNVYNMPLSGSPYTLETAGYFYFAVDNPVNGQTYSIIPL